MYFLYFFFIYACANVYVCGHLWTTEHEWTSEEHLWESILSFHHVGPGDQESGFMPSTPTQWAISLVLKKYFPLGIVAIPRLVGRYTFNNSWLYANCHDINGQVFMVLTVKDREQSVLNTSWHLCHILWSVAVAPWPPLYREWYLWSDVHTGEVGTKPTYACL